MQHFKNAKCSTLKNQQKSGLRKLVGRVLDVENCCFLQVVGFGKMFINQD